MQSQLNSMGFFEVVRPGQRSLLQNGTIKNGEDRVIIRALIFRYFINHFNMDRGQLFSQKLHSLFTLQRTFPVKGTAATTLSFEDYDSLQLLMLEECDRLGYQRNTKFAAKAYFDLAVSRLEELSSMTAPLYLLTAMGLAVKFNENRQRSQSFSIAAMVRMTNCAFQHIDFLKAELDLLGLLDYRLEIVTPYDYAAVFRLIINKYHNGKILEMKICRLVDFAISLPYLVLVSPLLLYWACFLEVIQRVKREDSEEIERLIEDREEVMRIRGSLRVAMEKVLKEGRLGQSDFNRV